MDREKNVAYGYNPHDRDSNQWVGYRGSFMYETRKKIAYLGYPTYVTIHAVECQHHTSAGTYTQLPC